MVRVFISLISLRSLISRKSDKFEKVNGLTGQTGVEQVAGSMGWPGGWNKSYSVHVFRGTNTESSGIRKKNRQTAKVGELNLRFPDQVYPAKRRGKVRTSQ